MKSTRGHLVALQSNRVCEPGHQEAAASRTLGAGLHDFNQQCLRILRCTAKAMANSPGGLRFKAGTRPWLEGLATVPVLVANGGQRISAGLPTASD
jgi:hypothetical protein